MNDFNFYGLKVSSFTKTSVIEFFNTSIKNKETKIAYGYSLGTISMIRDYPEIYKYGNEADLIVTDGRLFYLLLKFLNFPVSFDLSIPNMVNLILELANENSYSVMLIGATKEINNTAMLNLSKKFPNIKLKEGLDGYFGEEELDDIDCLIKKNDPDIILVGISSPKKEIYASRWKEHKSSRLIIPCGGMLDVLAGKTKQTPIFFKKIGLASFYRVLQEPKRLILRNFRIYFFILFHFLPKLFFCCIFRKKDDFSIPQYLLKENLSS